MFTWLRKTVRNLFALEGWERIKIENQMTFKRKFSSCLNLEFLYDDTAFSEVSDHMGQSCS
jgi:hypothetical protein